MNAVNVESISLKNRHLTQLQVIEPDLHDFLKKVDDMNINSDLSAMTLAKARREALKLNMRLNELKTEYNQSISLEFVEKDMHSAVLDVADARNIISQAHFECADRIKSLREYAKTLEQPSELASKANALSNQGKKVMRKIQDIILETPEVGMTFMEWEDMTAEDKKTMRPQGRPRAPIESEMMALKKGIDELVSVCIGLSDGKLNTLEKVLEGVKLSNQGRPQMSPLGKLSKQLSNSLKQLEEMMSEEKTRFHEVKKERLLEKIGALREEIRQHESLLEGADVYKWELEQLRSEHRDMVVAEQGLKDQNQVQMILQILRNEDRQIDLVDMIRDLDPDTNITITHRVNPAATRDRFDRIRENGRLSDTQMAEVDKIEKRLESYGRYRSR